ncbi:MAG: low molecular weight protein-tyrosine-phosphatase [Janthinobacterium lividum]
MKTILVVCIGNICRSPMAEAMLAAALPGVAVSSGGTGALIGEPADPTAQALMTEHGLDIGAHRGRLVNTAMCQQADLILTMDNEQRRFIEERYPLARGKVFRLGESARLDIPDPYRRGRAAFEHAYDLIEAGTRSWIERIRKFG